MSKCKKIFNICLIASLLLMCTGCVLKKEKTSKVDIQDKSHNVVKNTQTVVKEVKQKYDLYSNAIYDLPLFSVVEISRIPLEVKQVVDKLLEEAQGFYYLHYDGDKVYIILQNLIKNDSAYLRNNVQFVVVDNDAKVTSHIAGYFDKDDEIDTVKTKDDLWFFDKSDELNKPTKHIVYDEKGKVKFTEYWNYNEKEDIKYQIKNSSKKVISILKESQDNDSNFRKEHIFYDNEGNISMSLTVNYDGANISRFIYYNLNNIEDSLSIISEYENGLKVKEFIYNHKYELVKTVVSEYEDSIRKSIKVYDSQGVMLQEICS